MPSPSKRATCHVIKGTKGNGAQKRHEKKAVRGDIRGDGPQPVREPRKKSSEKADTEPPHPRLSGHPHIKGGSIVEGWERKEII